MSTGETTRVRDLDLVSPTVMRPGRKEAKNARMCRKPQFETKS